MLNRITSLAFTLSAAVACVAVSHAASPATPAPGVANPTTAAANPAGLPPADPFVREARAARAPETKSAAAQEAPVNLLTTLETWSMSQAEFVSLLDDTADGRLPYDRIEQLEKAGRAKLLGLMAISSPSGEKAVSETIDEIRYAMQFGPVEGGAEAAMPTQWETRNAGDSLEIETVLGPDGTTIDINLQAQTVRLAGFEEMRADGAAAPVSQPTFQTEKINTSMTVQSGRAAFLSTMTPAPWPQPEGGEVRVQFLRTCAQAAPRPVTALEGIGQVRVEVLIYSLDRGAARRLLIDSADSAKSHAAVRDLVAKGQAQIEVVPAFVCKSGQRAASEGIVEVRMPATAIAPASAASPGGPSKPGSFTFETRNTGVTIEAEAVTNGVFVNLSIVPQMVARAGTLKAEGIAAKYPPQPVFTTRKLTTSAITGLGVPVLLGTVSAPRDNGVNGRKDDNRTSLLYIRVTPARP